jgi:hypothetical protein
MSDQQHPMLPPDANATPEVDVARRRFAKAGGGASVILATLASKPVLAGWCIKPSMAGSGNHSQHQAQACNSTKSPSQWGNNGGIAGNLNQLPFHKIGNNGGIFAAPSSYLSLMNGNNSKSFSQVLAPGSNPTPQQRLGQALACAYLNALNSLTGPITTQDILSIGYDYITTGHYYPLSPILTPDWTINQITAYLEQIWGSVAVYP